MALTTVQAEAPRCAPALSADERVLMSAGSVADARIVAAGRGVGREMALLLDRLDLEAVPVTQASAQRIAAAYAKWGRGSHPGGLNFGNCFSYEVAKHHNWPLLDVGRDFARTERASVLG